jgi:hypothetical protein
LIFPLVLRIRSLLEDPISVCSLPNILSLWAKTSCKSAIFYYITGVPGDPEITASDCINPFLFNSSNPRAFTSNVTSSGLTVPNAEAVALGTSAAAIALTAVTIPSVFTVASPVPAVAVTLFAFLASSVSALDFSVATSPLILSSTYFFVTKS